MNRFILIALFYFPSMAFCAVGPSDSWSTTDAASGLAIGGTVSGGGANRILHEDSSQNLAATAGFTFTSSNYRLGIATGTPTISTGSGLDIEGLNAGIRLGITADQGWGYTEYSNESGVGKFIVGYRDVGETFSVRPGTSLGGSTGWSMNALGTVSLGANPYTVFADLYELNIGTSRNSSSGIVIANANTGTSSDSRVFLSNNVESHGISLVQYGQNYNTAAHSWADQDSGGLVAESLNDSLFLATNGASPIQFITNDSVRVIISSAGHVTAYGTAPTVSSCGTSPSIVGSSISGKVTIGSSASGTCTLTFPTAWVAAPVCTLTNSDADVPVGATTSTTALTITDGAATDFSSDTIMYVCIGQDGT